MRWLVILIFFSIFFASFTYAETIESPYVSVNLTTRSIQPDKYELIVNLKGEKESPQPIYAIFLIDTSKSMSHQLIGMRTRLSVSADYILKGIDKLDPSKDYICIIGFNSEPYLVQDFTNDYSLVKVSVKNMTTEGSTSLGEALIYATDKMEEKEDGKRVIVIFSDGLETSGTNISKLGQFIGEKNILVSTIGIGINNPNVRSVLTDISTEGSFYNVHDESTFQGAIDQIFKSIKTNIASTDTKIKATFPSNTTIYSAIPIPVIENGEMVWDIGTLFVGERRSIRIEIDNLGGVISVTSNNQVITKKIEYPFENISESTPELQAVPISEFPSKSLSDSIKEVISNALKIRPVKYGLLVLVGICILYILNILIKKIAFKLLALIKQGKRKEVLASILTFLALISLIVYSKI